MFIGFSHLQVVLICPIILSVCGWESDNAQTKGGRGGGPVREFTSHTLVTPHLTHTRTKRHITTTAHKDGHVHDITLGINMGDKDVLIDLQLNRDLLPKDYFEKYYHNGSQYVHRPEAEMAGLCHYQGVIRGQVGSWAALSTCHGISGVVFDGQELHYVERVPETPVAVNSPHYIFKHSNVIPQNFSCGYSGKPHPVRDLFHDETFTRLLRYKRSSSSSSSNIRGPFNANALSRYVELVLVTDKTEYKNHGHEVAKLYHRCKDIANIVNALYRPLNIFIALVGVEVWKDDDQVEISTDGDKTLTNFLNYRKVRLISDHPNDNAQLLTGKQFDAGVVGKALKGPICTYQYSGGVNMDHSDTVGLVATTVAHEMGHNFGMEHDNEEECECPDKRCIMAPSSGSKSPTHWSSCSYEYLALSFERSMDYCLRNKPKSLFDSPVCGNGFVEPGEQCDCGLPDYCTNTCCNASTCMLYPNATCATGHCCDLETCRPRLAGVECRSSVHECDLPEFCTGDSEYCPDDAFKANGHECLNGEAFCHSGMCRTHGEQCKLLWGPTGQSSDDRCYMMNTQGSHNGNCGYNWVNETYYKCSNENIKCGMLHCMHLNERLEFGMESVSKMSHSFLKSKKGVIPCRVALVDMGLDMVDPGLAPDGAKCGPGKMCVNQRCMPVAALKLASCNCHGNGVCNNNGHCHCDIGFAPPDCLYPGLGGSEDSGPASNPHATNTFVVVMFVIFLGIVPAALTVLCLTYYASGDLKLWWKTKGRPATSKLPHVDQGKRTSRPPGSLCVEVAGMGQQVDSSSSGAVTSPRSPTPPSSQGSKSNSPLLNGHVNSVMTGVLSQKPNSFTGSFFGKHEGFTLSPLKEKSPPSSKISEGPAPSAPPLTPAVAPSVSMPITPTNTIVTSSANGLSNGPVAYGWRIKATNQTGQKGASSITNGGSGVKMRISGPSLQGSTNPQIANHVTKNALPSRVAPPLPPPVATAAGPSLSVSTNMPPVAVITPSRRAPNLVTRPLSVPDASTLVAQVCKQGEHQDENSDLKRQEGDKQSTVARITSFLTKKDKQGVENNEADGETRRSNTLPRKAAKIKRESLVQLEISAPMQLHATELPANLVPVRSAPDPPMPSNIKPSQIKAAQEESSKPNKVSWAPSVPEDKIRTPTTGDSRSNIRVTWTPSALEKNDTTSELQRIGSMRETPVTIRPVIPKFGSMRAPRPKSLPPTRPSEPPPRPPLPMIPGTPESECFYDDCLNIQEGNAPIADVDEDTSPSENIYATIDDRTPDKEIPLQEVTYAPPDTVDGHREKKSIFSFLYNKPKKKIYKDKNLPEDDMVSEPVYTNLVESSPDDVAGSIGKVESPPASNTSSLSPPSLSIDDSNRTSCGSSEDGGLLSEIVTELTARDAEFVSSLTKKKNKRNKNADQVPKIDSRSLPSQNNKATPLVSTKVASPTEASLSSTDFNKTQNSGMSKSTSYPWRSKAVPDIAKKSSTSAMTSPVGGATVSDILPSHNRVDNNANNEPSKLVPRGVFSYINANNSGTTTNTRTTPSLNPTIPTISKSSTGLPESKKNQCGTTPSTLPVITTIPSTSTSTTTTASTTLASSLALVRAAAATVAAGNNKSVKNTDSSSNNKVGILKSSFTELGVPTQSGVSVSRPAVSIPTSAVITTDNVPVSAPSSTTSAGTVSVLKGVPSTTTTTSISSVPRSKRPVFPPDKVFPPYKVNSQTISTEKTPKVETNIQSTTSKDSSDKKSHVTSPVGGHSAARGRGSSPVSKVTSPVSKPGRLLSPTRGTTPLRGTTPTRNSNNASNSRGEKSRSTTPQPGAKKATGMGIKGEQKTGNKVNEKPANKTSDVMGNKTGIKPSEKPTEKGPKKPAVKSAPSFTKPTTAQGSKPSSSSGISNVNRSGRISNSHVASLQQKFEKKESEIQEPKLVTKVPSRKSQELKPMVAPKPK